MVQIATEPGLGEVQRRWTKLFSEKTLFSTTRTGRKVRSAWKIVNRKSRGVSVPGQIKFTLYIHIYLAARNGVVAVRIARLRVIMSTRGRTAIFVREFSRFAMRASARFFFIREGRDERSN